jgi:hypothetical protein
MAGISVGSIEVHFCHLSGRNEKTTIAGVPTETRTVLRVTPLGQTSLYISIFPSDNIGCITGHLSVSSQLIFRVYGTGFIAVSSTDTSLLAQIETHIAFEMFQHPHGSLCFFAHHHYDIAFFPLLSLCLQVHAF